MGGVAKHALLPDCNTCGTLNWHVKTSMWPFAFYLTVVCMEIIRKHMEMVNWRALCNTSRVFHSFVSIFQAHTTWHKNMRPCITDKTSFVVLNHDEVGVPQIWQQSEEIFSELGTLLPHACHL